MARVNVTIPDEQKDWLAEQPHLNVSGLLQQAISEERGPDKHWLMTEETLRQMDENKNQCSVRAGEEYMHTEYGKIRVESLSLNVVEVESNGRITANLMVEYYREPTEDEQKSVVVGRDGVSDPWMKREEEPLDTVIGLLTECDNNDD